PQDHGEVPGIDTRISQSANDPTHLQVDPREVLDVSARDEPAQTRPFQERARREVDLLLVLPGGDVEGVCGPPSERHELTERGQGRAAAGDHEADVSVGKLEEADGSRVRIRPVDLADAPLE